ncbi:MAG TPA: GPR1/FUN34/YaaH family transporter [Mycobacteriales bacterium]|jgi:hypothetical protein
MSSSTDTTADHPTPHTNGAAKHASDQVEAPEAGQVAAAPAPSTAFFGGNPAAVGVPVFVAGSVALALTLINYVPQLGAAIPIIFAATGLGLLLSTVWAASLGQTAVASIFGIFAGFWLSYAALVLGLTHNWFGILLRNIVHTTAMFLIVWLVILGLLTLGTLRLPLAFTALFVVIDAALAVLIVATINGDATLTKVAGYLTFAFAAVGAWIFLGVIDTASGGRGIPLGRPVIH